uniref:PIPK domain-containing protein n=1 Tax=Bionectria ochroleuca TaxID=29856 RepID=A0A8H7K853_BIOOC
MKIRASRISASIAHAIYQDQEPPDSHKRHGRLLRAIIAFFSLFRLWLVRYRPADFLALRRTAWQLDEDEYLDSFRNAYSSSSRAAELVPVGDLGYSGSTFFTTPDAKFLIKSLPRRFEHTFFTHDLCGPYLSHNTAHPDSLLVRITDMSWRTSSTASPPPPPPPLWTKRPPTAAESFDLKPADYFFPERDLANGRLAPSRVKDNLVDFVPHKIRVPPAAKRSLMDLLSRDTRLLASHSAVDYSLFLPLARGRRRRQGEWRYRAVVLDFFWCKRKLRARAMTGLVEAFNVVARRGPMSITAEPEEYRQRFLRMVDSIFVAFEAEDLLTGSESSDG